MKTLPTRLLLTAFLVVLALGVATRTQAQTVVKCDVPFAFALGGQEFPAGVYSFTVGSGPGSKVVTVRNWDGSQGEMLQAGVEDESPAIDTRVSFRRFGTRYLLSSVTIGGDAISVHFAPTRAEREMLARAGGGEVVTVLASR